LCARKTSGASYAGGLYVVAATLAVSAVVALVLSRWPGGSQFPQHRRVVQPVLLCAALLQTQELLQVVGCARNRPRQAELRHVVGKYAVDDVKLRGC
jgi:hypothetical protein